MAHVRGGLGLQVTYRLGTGKALSGLGVAFALTAILSGCAATMPGVGPLASQVVSTAGAKQRSDIVFDVVELDYATARRVADYVPSDLNRQFGVRTDNTPAVIGSGDVLEVTIFEAGPDGLFSTPEKKATPLTIVVQADGTASVPYVGSLKLKGKTVEEARQAIIAALHEKAIEPDVLINVAQNVSRTVSVSGAVGAPSIVPLNASGTRLMDVIARSGGATYPPYDSYVTVTRGNKTAMVLLQSVLDYPSENIPLRPGDQVYVTYDPRTFTALGAISRVGKIKFESQHLTLIEAGALAGGGDDTKADPKGYFVFRFENPEIVKVVIGHKRFNELVAAGMTPDENGNYPIVYRIDMSKPQSMLTGQVFPIANRDVIYVSRHPTRDFLKFVELVSAPLAFAAVVKSVD